MGDDIMGCNKINRLVWREVKGKHRFLLLGTEKTMGDQSETLQSNPIRSNQMVVAPLEFHRLQPLAVATSGPLEVQGQGMFPIHPYRR